jgi:hypothetical protein
VEIEAMDGKSFDAGMAVVVVDTIEDEQLEAGKALIEETVSPHGALERPRREEC